MYWKQNCLRIPHLISRPTFILFNLEILLRNLAVSALKLGSEITNSIYIISQNSQNKKLWHVQKREEEINSNFIILKVLNETKIRLIWREPAFQKGLIWIPSYKEDKHVALLFWASSSTFVVIQNSQLLFKKKK